MRGRRGSQQAETGSQYSRRSRERCLTRYPARAAQLALFLSSGGREQLQSGREHTWSFD